MFMFGNSDGKPEVGTTVDGQLDIPQLALPGEPHEPEAQ
jgi:hypothetical protein